MFHWEPTQRKKLLTLDEQIPISLAKLFLKRFMSLNPHHCCDRQIKWRSSFNHKFTNIPIHLEGWTLTINQLMSSLPKGEIHKENGLTDSFCFFVQVTSIKEVSALKMVPWCLLAWKNARANCQFSIPKEPPGYEQAMKTKLKKIFSQNY